MARTSLKSGGVACKGMKRERSTSIWFARTSRMCHGFNQSINFNFWDRCYSECTFSHQCLASPFSTPIQKGKLPGNTTFPNKTGTKNHSLTIEFWSDIFVSHNVPKRGFDYVDTRFSTCLHIGDIGLFDRRAASEDKDGNGRATNKLCKPNVSR